MKKLMISVLIAILSLGLASGQFPHVTVEWGPELPIPGKEKEQSYTICEDDQGGFYSLRERYKYLNGQVSNVQRFIEHFDADGNLTGSERFKIKHTGGDRFFDGIFQHEGRMYLVTYQLRRSDKTNVLSVQDIDPQTLLVSEKIRAVAEVPYERGLFGFVNRYSLKMANDKVYVFHAAPERGTGKTLVSLHVFDRDFNLQWKKLHALPYREELFQPEDFDIDRNGTVRVMASVYKDRKRKVRQGKPNYEYHFFVFSNRGKDYTEHTLRLGEKLITDMRFSYRPNGDIVCAGFYSDQYSLLRTNTIAGAFYLILDPESSGIKHENYKTFDEDILRYFMSADAARRGKEIKNVSLRNLHFLEDGTALLLAEEFTEYETAASMTYLSYSYGSDYWIQTTTTFKVKWMNYEFDNILVLKASPEGIIDFVDLIPKKQHTASDGGMYSSFATACVGDRIYLIYNDNPRNLSAGPGEIYRFRKKSKESVTVCAEIDAEGNITRKALFSSGDAETITCPRSCRQISGNQLKILGMKGRKCRWGVLEFRF